jgi:SAM-dependent methyltransferase
MKFLQHANEYRAVNQALLLADAIRQRMRHLLRQAPALGGTTRLAIHGCGLSGQITHFALSPALRVLRVFDRDTRWTGASMFETALSGPERLAEIGDAPLLVATAPQYHAEIAAKVRSLPGGEQTPIVFLHAEEPGLNRVTWDDRDGSFRLNLPYACIDDIMDQAARFIPFLDLARPARVAIYGCGMAGILARFACAVPRIPVLAFLDRNRKLHGQSYLGTPILGLGDAAAAGVTDLLVALSPRQALGAAEAVRSSGLALDTLQCLFRIPGTSPGRMVLHGMVLESGLGGGSEGLAYVARNGSGRFVLKQFKQPRPMPALEQYAEAHRRNTLGLPRIRLAHDDGGRVTACIAPYQPTRGIPQGLFQDDAGRKVLAAYYLRLQHHLVARRRLCYVDRISHFNYRLRRDGRPVVVDLGGALAPLEGIRPEELQRIVLNALAILLPGRMHRLMDREILAPGWSDRLLEHARATLGPGQAWLLGLLEDLRSLAPAALLRPGTYLRLIREHGLSAWTRAVPGSLPAPEVLPPALEVQVDGASWLVEDAYQEFRYAPGRLEPFGETLRKLEGLPFFGDGFAGRSYLDLGCDAGFFVTRAALSGARTAMGLDVTGHSVLKAATIAGIVNPGADCRFVEGSVPEHAFGRTFDVASAFSLIHHLYQNKARFKDLHAVLRYLASLATEAAVVEFVAVEEGNAYGYAPLAGDPDYNEENFVAGMSALFGEVRLVNSLTRHKKVYLGRGLRRP